jgi:hypothetical protein
MPIQLGSLRPRAGKDNYLLHILHAMVNKARSQALKKQILRKEVDDLKTYAARLYNAEQVKSLAPEERKKSSSQIC